MKKGSFFLNICSMRKLKNNELDRLSIDDFKSVKKTPLIVILDNIRSEQAENATMLNDFTPEKNTIYALVFGNEVKGVSQEVVSASDVVIEIPQYGTKHSLNISVSAGVVIWDVFSKLKKNS